MRPGRTTDVETRGFNPRPAERVRGASGSSSPHLYPDVAPSYPRPVAHSSSGWVGCLAPLVLLAGCGGGADTGTDDTSPANLFDDHTLSIAHRGGVDEFPEHTLFAYGAAADLGVDVLELDVHRSADGVIVAIHDDTVDRTTEGSGAVAELSASELRTLDAAYWFTLDGTSYPERGRGHVIPTLPEVLEAFPTTPLTIEIKADDAELGRDVVAMLDAAGRHEDSYVWSAHVDVTEAARTSGSGIMVGLNYAEMVQLSAHPVEDLGSYVAPGPFAQIPLDLNGLKILDEALVDKAHAAGIRVHAWTINDPEDMQRMLDWGVDGIITDRPSQLLEFLPED